MLRQVSRVDRGRVGGQILGRCPRDQTPIGADAHGYLVFLHRLTETGTAHKAFFDDVPQGGVHVEFDPQVRVIPQNGLQLGPDMPIQRMGRNCHADRSGRSIAKSHECGDLHLEIRDPGRKYPSRFR
jgi:hypothetical protein